MRILFISSQALFEDTRFGGAKRLYYLARQLARHAELHLICLDGCGEIVPPKEMPREFERLLFVPTERAGSLLGKLPFLPDAATSIHSKRQEISAFLRGKQFDATLLAFPDALHFLNRGLVPAAGKIVYLEDDLLPETLEARLRSTTNPWMKLWRKIRRRQADRYYRRGLRNASEFVCISPQEEKVVRARWPHLATDLLGYGLPLENFPLLPPPERPHVLGFIGNYRHPPNRDAARWLIRDLFPHVLKSFPDAELVLCGPGFPEELRAECPAGGPVRVLGEVEDLSRFYRSISVFVNPLREGRGLRTKVVEAAAFGRPIVSTLLGAEGLETLQIGLFETAEQLVERLRELDPAVAAAAIAHNRGEAERGFSMEAVGEELLTILARS